MRGDPREMRYWIWGIPCTATLNSRDQLLPLPLAGRVVNVVLAHDELGAKWATQAETTPPL